MIWRVATIVLAAILALVLIPAARHLREQPPADEPPVRLTLDPPAGTEFGAADSSLDLAMSPTGREMVVAAVTAGETQLWRRPLDNLRAEPIPGTAAAIMPAYSGDGSSVWFFAEGKLRSVTLASGERREHANAPAPAGVAVRGDGVVLFAPSAGPIQRIAGGAPMAATTLRPGERTHAFPSWIGGGEAFVYLATRDDGRHMIRLRDGEDDRELTRADSHGVVSVGRLLFVRDGALRSEPLDMEARRLGPRSTTLAFNVGVSPQGRGAFAVGGRILASAPPVRSARVLRWFSETGDPLDVISEPADYWQVRLSPDERTVALTIVDPLLRTLDVFTLPVTGGTPTRVSLALAADSDPVWSGDGRRLAFRSAQEGQPQVHTTDGPLVRSPLDEFPTDWTSGALIFHARSPESGFDIWTVSPPAEEPRAVARSGFNEIDGRVSPDGRWIAYASDEGGQFDVYIAPLDGSGARTRVSLAGGARPEWITGGRALLFLRGDALMRVNLSSDGSTLRANTPVRLFSIPQVRDYAPARSGKRLLALVPAATVRPPKIDIVVGWASE